MMQAGETTLQFTCRPERFFKSGETEITVSNGDKLVNATNYTAKPLIYIEVPAEETVTVSIGGKSIVANVDDYIYIDSERMNAYRTAAENMNSEVSGTFPTIAPGENGIGITGTVTKVTIIPRYFTI
jgi:phage-related protein